MTQAIRDIAQIRNNLLATVKAAGATGMPLLDALQKVTGRAKPTGHDYTIALQLRREKFLSAYPSGLGRHKLVVHKDFMHGIPHEDAVVAAEDAGAAAVVDKVPVAVRRRRTRASPTNPAATLLITIQYGRSDSVTLSFDQARQVYRQLAAVFGRE